MFEFPSFLGDGAVLKGERIMLRQPRSGDYAQWSAVRAESRGFLEPWEPRWTPDELSQTGWRQRLRQYRAESKRKTGFTYFVFDVESGTLAGGISIANIRRGASQSAQIGYWMGIRHAGKGLMSEAVRLVVDHAFEALMLHRIEAACIPGNTRSIRLLEKAGFRREGLLYAYLRINGEWQDHFLYAKVRDHAPNGQTGG